MQLPQLNFETAFAMTALFSWALVGLLWVVVRNYPRQGGAWIMGSVFSLGTGYLLIAFSDVLPHQPTLLSAYCLLSLTPSLTMLGLRRFLQRPWGWVDGLVALVPVAFTLLWSLMAGDDFAFHVWLSNLGFILQIMMIWALLWREHKAMVGNGWKVMLIGSIFQWLALLPYILPGRAPSTLSFVPHTVAELAVAWVVCIVMFINLQISALSFLMMLQDKRNAEEREAAEMDVLTQLPNRRSLDRRLSKILPAIYRQHAELGVVLLDIDHFKKVNDTYGHAAGDRVLQHVAHVLRQQLRQNELLARYGGEEFVIVLPYASQDMAASVAQRVVQAVGSTDLGQQGLPASVTISAGVYVQKLALKDLSGPGAPLHWHELVNRADEALYEAKRSGRNRYVVASRQPVASPA